MNRNALYYIFSNVFIALVPFILLPILTRSLTVSEYGLLSIFLAVVSSTASFIGLNAVSAANRFFFDDIDCDTISKYNGICFQVILLGLLISLSLTISARNYVSTYIGIDFYWVVSALLIGFFHQLILLRLGQWQIRQYAIRYFFFQFSLGVALIILTLTLLKYVGNEVEVVIFSRICVFAGFALISLYLLYKDKLIRFWCFNQTRLKDVIKYSLPLLPHTVGLYFISFLDRFFVFSKFGSETAGFYMIAVQFSMVMMLIFDALNRAFTPKLYQLLKKEDIEKMALVVRAKLMFVVFSVIILPFFYYVSPKVIVYFAGDKYLESVSILNILVIGQIFGGLYLLFTNYIFYAKATSSLAAVTIVSFSLHLALLIFLPKEFGVEGIAWVFVVTKFNQFLLTFLLSRKYVDLPWKKGVCFWQ
ncbi:hypothetical protein AOR11_15550 [Vibrio alginolyticus]|uniref:lipopolysaccharide biosynthesis protein n=1 Tax=Vibrio TaxID=662 RepID=UPI0006CA7B6B|nr:MULTISPECIES: oligosaccharide flippase family protein [Vibrio]EGQ8469060.1 oligosaccharide flippase family protein [Vibrio alginolyticus]KPN01978.1 hypothetical protein AOR11_15550 [Vibrio alginolyticus]MDW1628894.1 oligosaccharide flippase family protein [Vibrio sp. Y176]